MEDKKKIQMIIYLLYILIALVLITGWHNEYITQKECNDELWGTDHAIHLFKEQCESNRMLFGYVTQGKFLRCFNESVTIFYNIKFEYRSEIAQD